MREIEVGAERDWGLGVFFISVFSISFHIYIVNNIESRVAESAYALQRTLHHHCRCDEKKGPPMAQGMPAAIHKTQHQQSTCFELMNIYSHSFFY